MSALQDLETKNESVGIEDMDKIELIILSGYSEDVFDEYDREKAAEELAELRAIKQAAWEFVNADGRNDPNGKYQALKDLVNKGGAE